MNSETFFQMSIEKVIMGNFIWIYLHLRRIFPEGRRLNDLYRHHFVHIKWKRKTTSNCMYWTLYFQHTNITDVLHVINMTHFSLLVSKSDDHMQIMVWNNVKYRGEHTHTQTHKTLSSLAAWYIVTIGLREWIFTTMPPLITRGLFLCIFPELVAQLWVFIMTICCTISDDKVSIMTFRHFQCLLVTTCSAANDNKVHARSILFYQYQNNPLLYIETNLLTQDTCMDSKIGVVVCWSTLTKLAAWPNSNRLYKWWPSSHRTGLVSAPSC